MEDIDEALLEQWLNDQSFVNWAKQLDDGDIVKWEEYLLIHPEHRSVAKAGRVIVLGIPFQRIQSDETQRKKSLARLLEKLESNSQSVVKKDKKPRYKTGIFKISKSWLVAASIAIFILFFSMSYFQFIYSSDVILVSEYGEKTEILLPDGSSVVLNSNSSLTYNTKTPRILSLEGEAFFVVEKKPETGEKFLVITQDLTVEVLGTSFNVNARNDQTKVFLEEGRVELNIKNSENEIIKMNPGDLITYSEKDNKIKENRKNVSVLENASWKDGALIFNKTKLKYALYDIEDIYGIQFVIESDELKSEEITGGVPIGNLKVTMETLKEVYGIQFKREGQRYFLSRRVE